MVGMFVQPIMMLSLRRRAKPNRENDAVVLARTCTDVTFIVELNDKS
jgi:hypothetical protein